MRQGAAGPDGAGGAGVQGGAGGRDGAEGELQGEHLILRLPGPPPGAPAPPRDGAGREPGRPTAAQRLRAAARRAMDGRPPLEGPLRLAVEWSGTGTGAGAAQVLAGVEDALLGVALTERSQVVAASCTHQPSAAGEGCTVDLARPADARRHATASVFATCRGRVLLLRHRSKGLWLPPGGHVEADESVVRAAVREVAEETGIDVDISSAPIPAGTPSALPRPEALLDVEVAPGHHHEDLVFFAEPRGRPARPPEPVAGREAAEVRWLAPDELERLGEALPPDVAALARRALSAVGGPSTGR